MHQLTNQFHSTGENFDKKFDGRLGVWDMERLYKMAKYFKSGKYLEVGCFDSIMPILLAENKKNTVYALDHATKTIEFLKERFPKVNYIVGDAYKLPFKDKSLNYVSAGEVIEHLERPDDFIKEAFRVLDDGGYLALSTPFEEKNGELGGKYHMWSWTVEDFKKRGFEVEVLQEVNFKSIIAWLLK